MGRDRRIYLRLLAELENAKDHLDKINRTIHEMIDEWDQQVADKVKEEHAKWMEDNDE